MTSIQLKEALKNLTSNALAPIAASPLWADGSGRAIAYYDPRKDQLVTGIPSFPQTVQALEASPAVSSVFGANEAPRIALQFVFNVYEHVANAESFENSFESVWDGLVRELEIPTWTYIAVANVQNFQGVEEKLDLGDGVSVRHVPSLDQLAPLLQWDPSKLSFLARDWMDTYSSNFVLLAEKSVPKTSANLTLVNDSAAHARVARTLLALRLLAPGDLRIGRIFFARPSSFNVGIGGVSSVGSSSWHMGRPYWLSADHVPLVKEWRGLLASLDDQPEKQTRNLKLALRSFSSIYDRDSHQAEDRVLDAITALEALWKLTGELAFRLAFQTAALLGNTDDERVSIYETISQYYKIRSSVVHGTTLKDTQAKLMAEDEPIRSIVRRTLRAFVYLAGNPGEWTLARLYDEADVTLLHAARREGLRTAMGISATA